MVKGMGVMDKVLDRAGEDIGIKGGVFLATDGLFKRFGARRVIDTPIAEASIVGLAIGMSLHGLRPVAEIQFADYIHPAIDQILNEAARFRYRSNGDWHCPIVVRAQFGAGVHDALYHSQSTEALEAHYMLSPEKIAHAIRDLAAY
jgi:2-oxoisovalerate dehydrogenase E1 component beta subunit